MPYLRFHPVSGVTAAASPLPRSAEGLSADRLHLGPTTAAEPGFDCDALGGVGGAIDLVERRLENLRDLIARFGLDEDDGPKAA